MSTNSPSGTGAPKSSLSNPVTGVVVQARMASTRLPGKVLMPIGDVPMIGRLLRRLSFAAVDTIIVATSTEPADDPIADYAGSEGVRCFRGSEQDVLSRYCGAARTFGLDGVVRVTADNPFTDPWAITELLNVSREQPLAYVHNVHPDGYPYGTGAELVPVSFLTEVAESTSDPRWREHVTLGVRVQPSKYLQVAVPAPSVLRGLPYCFSVDYPEDLAFVRELWARCNYRDDVRLVEMLELLRSNPDLVRNCGAPRRSFEAQEGKL